MVDIGTSAPVLTISKRSLPVTPAAGSDDEPFVFSPEQLKQAKQSTAPPSKPAAPAVPAAPAAPSENDQPFTFTPEELKRAAPSLDEQLKQLGTMLSGQDPTVDYTTGAPWNVQLALARADKPAEAAAMLERRVGKDNYGQDASGNWWVKQGDKKVAVRPKGGIGAAFGNFGVDMAATSPTMAGALGGALAGSEGGPAGMVVGAGIGGLAGYGSSEAEKGLEGSLRKTPGEEALALGREGALNAALQGAMPALGTVGRGVGNFMRDFVETHTTHPRDYRPAHPGRRAAAACLGCAGRESGAVRPAHA